jgi:ribosomal protein S17E
MVWTSKYWDIVEQLYWTPRYVGMNSIPRKHWREKNGFICIPAKSINKSGPLYSRERKIDDLKAYLNRSEEILNDVFDLTFSIAPDSIINEIFLTPLGFNDFGPFESIGRESASRYGWGKYDNITQHDGLFVSRKSAVAIELKLRSKSSRNQIAKYLALLAWEELFNGCKEQLGLLFIIPDAAIQNHWYNCGLGGPYLNSDFLETIRNLPLPKQITDLFDANRDHVQSVLNRIKLAVISWKGLKGRLVSIEESLDLSRRGDQTLAKLIKGFLFQLEAHGDTGIR